MQWVKEKRTGFTIVELLIVIVVIAILAAITIVAYTGIQDRATQSSLQSSAKQAYTKIQTYAVENNETYPTALSSIGLTDTPDVTYTYRTDSTTAPKAFCLVASRQSTDYFVTSENSSPTAGNCANMVGNPSFEANTNGWNAGGANVLSRVSTGGLFENGFARSSYASASSETAGNWYPNIPIVNGKIYTGSMYVRSNIGVTVLMRLEWKNSSGTIQSYVTSPTTTLVPNTWTRLSMTGTAPGGSATNMTITWQRSGGAGITWTAGSRLDVDGVIVTQTDSVVPYTN
ncbi:TPA: hypothetical protein DD425_01335 [Candidatus Saccharibacteria bacterium]|nr:hypothetical protein [Candidatus Saccharibacteria bacterium]|tara:strand:- start:754 stop:1614 length:861 start_codon:yes stop_codon:yes gene_type:complete